jgi:hypothetical protein
MKEAKFIVPIVIAGEALTFKTKQDVTLIKWQKKLHNDLSLLGIVISRNFIEEVNGN